MIITTTPSVEGRAIREYKGIAFGEVITGVNFMKDLGAGLRNFFGGRSAGYEEELQKARGEALAELEQMGLAAPQVSYVFAKLKEKGYDVPTDIYTVEEARDALLKLVKQVKA